MKQLFVGCDAHKHYSQLEVQDSTPHRSSAASASTTLPRRYHFFSKCVFPCTPVALESVGNWYWIADEIEAAGCSPLLTNPGKAKPIMGHVNKTDKLDAAALPLCCD